MTDSGYKMVVAQKNEAKKFVEEVNEAISDGWRLHGLTEADWVQKVWNLVRGLLENGARVGVRVVGDDDPIQVGKAPRQSRVWMDNEPTDRTLSGTSVIDLESRVVDRKGLRKAVQPYMWIGDRLAVLAGDNADPGNDEGEIVLKNNVEVLAVFRM